MAAIVLRGRPVLVRELGRGRFIVDTDRCPSCGAPGPIGAHAGEGGDLYCDCGNHRLGALATKVVRGIAGETDVEGRLCGEFAKLEVNALGDIVAVPPAFIPPLTLVACERDFLNAAPFEVLAAAPDLLEPADDEDAEEAWDFFSTKIAVAAGELRVNGVTVAALALGSALPDIAFWRLVRAALRANLWITKVPVDATGVGWRVHYVVPDDPVKRAHDGVYPPSGRGRKSRHA